jgi:hypothetical protein
MSSYETEHARDAPSTSSTQPRRPDLSTFFTALDLTAAPSTSSNSHTTEPLPSNVSAAYRMLANALQVMNGETEGVAIDHGFSPREQSGGLLDGMIESLMMGAERPPREVDGMSDEWFVGMSSY